MDTSLFSRDPARDATAKQAELYGAGKRGHSSLGNAMLLAEELDRYDQQLILRGAD